MRVRTPSEPVKAALLALFGVALIAPLLIAALALCERRIAAADLAAQETTLGISYRTAGVR